MGQNFCGCGKSTTKTMEESLSTKERKNDTTDSGTSDMIYKKPNPDKKVFYSESSNYDQMKTMISQNGPNSTKSNLKIKNSKKILEEESEENIKNKNLNKKLSVREFKRVASDVFTNDDNKVIEETSNNKIMNGFGIKKLGKNAEYKGYFKNGEFNGYGILKENDGAIYKGEFKNNKANGYGEYLESQGGLIKGFWKDDNKSGIGEEIWEDNSIYQGEYSNNKKEGIGYYRFGNPEDIYMGEWRDNKIEGYGILIQSNGKIYVGEFKNFKMNGYGEFTWTNGNKYFGFYHNDKRDGFGIYYWQKNKKFYVGFFKDGKQHGLSKYIINDKIFYYQWDNGKKIFEFSNIDQLIQQMDPSEFKFQKYLKMQINELKKFMENDNENIKNFLNDK